MIQTEREFRQLVHPSDFCEVEDIQRDAWGMSDIEIVPKREMFATCKSGGVAIGCFTTKSMIGYCWGWVGKTNKHDVFLYSHHNAVRKTFQNQGIGYLLKLQQREWGIQNNFKMINWTFDPLQSKNCYLNFHKLGATCDTYHSNYWGPMHDAENIGMDTDRFYCNWILKSERVKQKLDQKVEHFDEEILNPSNYTIKTDIREDNLIINRINLNLISPTLIVEIPSNINFMKKHNLDLVVEWREKTRKVFQTYFKKGYAVTDFVLKRDGTNILNTFHILTKNGDS